MKKDLIYRFSLLFVWLFTVHVQAQKETETFRESFEVNPDVTIEVNTSHTDVEFETWDRNTVEVLATIEVGGISREEAEKYLESWEFKATGDKKRISVATRPGNIWIADADGMNFNFVLPDMPEIPEMPDIPDFADIPVPPVPPMPPQVLDMTNLSFDYEAYKKEGDKYMEEWKKKWEETFDEKFKKQMESWKKKMEAHREEVEENAKKIKIDREKIKEHAEKARQAAEKARKQAIKVREEAGDQAPSIFYFYSDGKEKEVNVKKRILIKMPKGAKLKMNVRHGEVKLAENSENIRATLSHASLRANRVNGKETSIETSYAPVLVHNWNGGKLKVNYVKEVDLENVSSLELISNSSDVTVENLLHSGHIQGSFGSLEVKNIGRNFNRLDLVLDNTNAMIVLPESGFRLFFNGEDSNIKIPPGLKVSTTVEKGNTEIKGYHQNSGSDRQITVRARYSDIIFN
ncbi:hypothetical protein LS482_04515 [Sinomicrobium kalidii]|uniref:hypothetical protein n=1 Tax=Sinomicrobium kalidii TaxID=2900738 RepID=UPI001E630EBA|nr:hypothetical protein [Sinomicrobium kalidii]UGU17136.1 hypothetical protein LS482_04515 [Sinomicrobium kalidii]